MYANIKRDIENAFEGKEWAYIAIKYKENFYRINIVVSDDEKSYPVPSSFENIYDARKVADEWNTERGMTKVKSLDIYDKHLDLREIALNKPLGHTPSE